MVISPAFTIAVSFPEPDCRSPMDLPAMSSSLFKVRVTKDYLVFCSGHFITYDGDHCERIHGHNYRTPVEVEGDLDQNHYVVDFIALKDLTRAITDELDHRMLLPTRSRQIHLHEDGANIRVTYRDRYWSFPRDECAFPTRRQHHGRAARRLHRRRRLRQAMTARGWELAPHPCVSKSRRALARRRRSSGARRRAAERLILRSPRCIESLEFPSTDPAVVDGRADQDRGCTGVADRQDFFNSGDAAAHNVSKRSRAPRIRAIKVWCPSLGQFPRARDQESEMLNTALDRRQARSNGSSFPSRRRGFGGLLEQVETEDDPLRAAIRMYRLNSRRPAMVSSPTTIVSSPDRLEQGSTEAGSRTPARSRDGSPRRSFHDRCRNAVGNPRSRPGRPGKAFAIPA